MNQKEAQLRRSPVVFPLIDTVAEGHTLGTPKGWRFAQIGITNTSRFFIR